MTAQLSVVIPCFNHGAFVAEAVESALAQTHPALEVIIVDDGSTDRPTVELLSKCPWPRTRVIRTQNQGPAAARNTGIEAGSGQYVLPLDADDRIGPAYAAEAIKVLEADRRVSAVYCEAEFFGQRTGRWNLPPFDRDLMLFINHVFCAAVFRRSDWQAAGGYRANMRFGFEDWDFWMSLLENGKRFHQLPGRMFAYRIHPGSRTRQLGLRTKLWMFGRLIANHKRLYAAHPIGVARGMLRAALASDFRP